MLEGFHHAAFSVRDLERAMRSIVVLQQECWRLKQAGLASHCAPYDVGDWRVTADLSGGHGTAAGRGELHAPDPVTSHFAASAVLMRKDDLCVRENFCRASATGALAHGRALMCLTMRARGCRQKADCRWRCVD